MQIFLQVFFDLSYSVYSEINENDMFQSDHTVSERISQLIFTCSKSTIQTLQKEVKRVQS